MIHFYSVMYRQSYIYSGRVALFTLCASTSEDMQAVLSRNVENPQQLLVVTMQHHVFCNIYEQIRCKRDIVVIGGQV